MLLSRRDFVLLALLTLLWGINWPIMKLGVVDYPPLAFRSISMLGGIAAVWLALRAARLPLKVPPGGWPQLLALAIPNMIVWHVFAIYGVKLLASGRAAILGYTMPVWAALWGLLLFREHIGPWAWAGVACAFGGTILLLSGELGAIPGQPAGAVAMLVAAAGWGLGTHLMRRQAPDMPILSCVFWMMVMTLPVMMAISLLFENITRWPNAVEWGSIAFNAVIVFGVCHTVWFHLARTLPPVASSLSTMLIPLVGLFSGMWMLNEAPHWQDYVATALILASLASALLVRPAAAK